MTVGQAVESGGTGGGTGVDFGAPPGSEAGAFSGHQQRQHQHPHSQRQYSADSRGGDGGLGGAGEYPSSSMPFDGGRDIGDSSGRVGTNSAEGGGGGVPSHRVAHASRQDGVDGGKRGGAAAAAAAAAASASFPRRYDYVEYSTPMEFRAGGAVSSAMVDDRGGGAHRQAAAVLPQQQQMQQQQRDMRASAGVLSGEMSRSQPNTPHGGEGGGTWDGGGGSGGGSGGGAGGTMPSMAGAEGAGHGAVGSGGAGGGGELEYSDGYTAHRSSGMSSVHHVTRHNAVSN